MHDVAPFNDQTDSDPSLIIHVSCGQDAFLKSDKVHVGKPKGLWISETRILVVGELKSRMIST